MTTRPQISLIVPLFNEEQTLPYLKRRLESVLKKFSDVAEIILVDDGSSDSTASILTRLAKSDRRYVAVLLARNYGQQIAISAGLAESRGRAVMVLDADMQDPPELLPIFYKKYQAGFDVVYGIRKNRRESWLLKLCYKLYYRFLGSIAYTDLALDSGDFSLMSRRVVDILNEMPENSRYIRGMRSWVGFRQIGVPYERDERIAGEPKYTLKKLTTLALDGIFNFSNVPIRVIGILGLVAIIIALGYFIYTAVDKILYGNVPQGFTGLLFALVMFSGTQLISLAVIGEYVLRIFFQVKGRPLYNIREIVSLEKRRG